MAECYAMSQPNLYSPLSLQGPAHSLVRGRDPVLHGQSGLTQARLEEFEAADVPPFEGKEATLEVEMERGVWTFVRQVGSQP